MTEHDVAIIGMACIFPKAPDLETFWHNIREGVDAITDVPESRWDPSFYDPASSAVDRFYARRGGFIDEYTNFDPMSFGIMPIAARGAEPDQLLALQVATDALKDAGYQDRAFPREKTSVILGRGNYLGSGMLRLLDITRGASQLAQTLRDVMPQLDEAQIDAIKQDFQAKCGIYGPDTAIGLVPNLVASRIANRLDLGGSAYTLDSACASSLIAVDHACRELRYGQADMVIAGGIHLCHDPAFWSVFTQLGAISRTQSIRPFSSDADGLLIGEGLGVFILKRESDAIRDKDRIYAVIRGIGVSSDGREASLLTPGVQGQVLAVTRAWEDAGLDPATVGLIEAHGTATNAGDSAELETLSRVFGPLGEGEERVPLGSVKSMIGHAMPAAGAAGLMKAVLSVYHGVLPPTLHCDSPNEAIEKTRFRVIDKAEPWPSEVRRAGVNAFGFGGINAHVIIDSPASVAASNAGAPKSGAGTEAIVIAARSEAELLERLEARQSGGEGPVRLAVFDPTPERIEIAKAAVAAGRPRAGRDGILFTKNGLISQQGKVAFVFPGVETNFDPNIEDMAPYFDIPQPDFLGTDLEHKGLGIFFLNSYLHKVAEELNLKPDIMAGHSMGEWSGMLASGMLENTSVDRLLESLQPGTLQVADLNYLAVGAAAARAQSFITDLPGVTISHDNCVHQSIVCGPEAQIEVLQQRLREARVLNELLSFKSGFHSPALAQHTKHYVDYLETVSMQKPSTPLWSATTCAPYPDDPEAIKALFVEHLLKPVRFRELILSLYDAGVRVFVQVGTGSLASFIDDTLAGKPHNAVSLMSNLRSGLEQLQRSAAALFVEGADVDLERLGLMKAQPTAAAKSQRSMTLELGIPLVKVEVPPLSLVQADAAEAPIGSDPLSVEIAGNLRAMREAQEAVSRAMARLPVAFGVTPPRMPAPPVPPTPLVAVPEPPKLLPDRVEEMTMSLEVYPELIDHSLFPQPDYWPDPADRGPTSPMTMSLQLLREAAQRADPTRVPIAVENITAKTWFYAEPAVDFTTTTKQIDPDRFRVTLGQFVEGTVVMADKFPDPPAPNQEPLVDLHPPALDIADIYRKKWLFHGPQFQGIKRINAMGSNGINGTLVMKPAKGSLLDNAGQLYGYWICEGFERDRLAMPVRIEKTEFFGPEPENGELLDCTTWIRAQSRRDVRADLEVVQDGKLYCRITGWVDWRFFTNDKIYNIIRESQYYLLADEAPGGFTILNDPTWNPSIYEFLAHRFLSSKELDAQGGYRTVQRQLDWLKGRIAAKDAVRKLLFERGLDAVYPIEITIESEASGKPIVTGRYAQDFRVSIAHKEDIAVAIAADGVDPGIDVEKIEPRSEAFAALAFSPDELSLVPSGSRDEWLTRMWCAKEAAGKAAGTGLAGNPKGLKITNIIDERILVEGRWVNTQTIGEHVVAWTVQ